MRHCFPTQARWLTLNKGQSPRHTTAGSHLETFNSARQPRDLTGRRSIPLNGSGISLENVWPQTMLAANTQCVKRRVMRNLPITLMKRLMKTSKATLTILLVAVCQIALGQQGSLMASYPLNSTPNDTTGHFAPMLLTNTPFEGGGIYCNGIYQFSSDSSWCQAETPVLPTSIFQSFSVSAKFKVDSIPGRERPVIIGGSGWRWIGCLLRPDSTVALLYNNQNRELSTLHYSSSTWQEVTITYDSSTIIAKLYLNGALACSILFTIEHGPEYDRTFGVTNPSNATVFKGFLKDLKIYSTVIVPTTVQDISSLLPENIQLSQNYPNPFNPSTTIRFRLPHSGFVDLSVHDILGQKIATLVSGYLVAGEHTIQWSATGHASGAYFYRLQADKLSETKKLLLSK